MKCNVGKTDRFLRILIGIVILVIGYIQSNWWGLLGLVILLTGLSRVCLIYLPFKINTAKSDK